MNIKINRRFTTLSGLEVATKSAIKFKAMYTDNDVREFIQDELNIDLSGEIIFLDCEVWNCDICNRPQKTIFYVNSLVVKNFTKTIKLCNIAFDMEFNLVNPVLPIVTTKDI